MDNSPSGLARAFESVRLKLMSSGLLAAADASSCLALTAIGRSGGVTTVAIGTAAAIARQDEGAVLLVDGTPLGTRCAAMLGVTAPALVSNASGAALDECLTPVPALGITLLQLAAAPPQAGDAAAAASWAALWQTLRGRYRHLIVDAGSLKTHAPLRWAGWVDHTALVIDTSQTTRDMLEGLRREMRHGGPALAGFILNKRRFHVPARLYRALS
ncbi:hypothetical protein BH11PSE10_BH11PSE10_06020 [soil metagenome]